MRELSTGRKRFIFKSCYILSIYSLICNLIRYSQLVGDFPSSVVDSTLPKNGLFISLTDIVDWLYCVSQLPNVV